MSLTVGEYAARLAVTVRVEEALRRLLLEMGLSLPETGGGFPVLRSRWGESVLEAGFQAMCDRGVSAYDEADARLTLPELADGNLAPLPVIARPAFAADMVRVLTAFNPSADPVHLATPDALASGIAIFIGQTHAPFWQESAGVGLSVFAGGVAGRHVPLTIDYSNPHREGMERYLALHPRLITYHTADQIYLQQLLRAVETATASDVDRDFASELMRVKAVLDRIVDDLELYYFEHGSLAIRHAERIQRHLYHSERPVRVGRLHLNMTDANKRDPSGKLGNVYLKAVLAWLTKKFPDAHVIQNPERTTFQFIITEGLDVADIFKTFARDVKREIRHINRHEPRDQRVDDAMESGFIPCGMVAELPLSRANILGYAIRTPDDVEVFRGILRELVPNETLLGAMERDEAAAAVVLDKISVDFLALATEYKKAAAQLGQMMEEAGEADWVNLYDVVRSPDEVSKFDVLLQDVLGERLLNALQSDFAAAREGLRDRNVQIGRYVVRYQNLNRALIALMLAGIHNHSRVLAGHTTYLEKHVTGLKKHPPVVSNGAPRSGTPEYDVYAEYVGSGRGYVPCGVYDPRDNPGLAAHDFGDLPQYAGRSGLYRGGSILDGSPRIEEMLAAHPRLGHDFGHLTRPRCGDEPGGAREHLFIAVDDVALSAGLAPAEKERRLEALRLSLKVFVDIARGVWQAAICDPKYLGGFKHHFTFETREGFKYANMFLQELALRGWTNLAALEYDSFQAFSHLNPPDPRDSHFQVVRDFIFEVAQDFHMPSPLIFPAGGDLVYFSWAGVDKSGRSVSPAAFVREVQRRVYRSHASRRFQDVKKVQMREVDIRLAEAYPPTAIAVALAGVADDLGLRTVPEIVTDMVNGEVRLYIPVKDSSGNDLAVEQVINRLDARGVSVPKFSVSGAVVTSRQLIWEKRQGDGGPVRYMYGNVKPNGVSPFFRTFTVTTVYTEASELGDPDRVDAMQALIGGMGRRLDELKEMNPPHKGAFGYYAFEAPTESGLIKVVGDTQRQFTGLGERLSHGSLSVVGGFARNVARGLAEYESLKSTGHVSETQLLGILQSALSLSGDRDLNDFIRVHVAGLNVARDELIGACVKIEYLKDRSVTERRVAQGAGVIVDLNGLVEKQGEAALALQNIAEHLKSVGVYLQGISSGVVHVSRLRAAIDAIGPEIARFERQFADRRRDGGSGSGSATNDIGGLTTGIGAGEEGSTASHLLGAAVYVDRSGGYGYSIPASAGAGLMAVVGWNWTPIPYGIPASASFLAGQVSVTAVSLPMAAFGSL